MTIPSRHLGDTRSGKKICTYDTKELNYIRSLTNQFGKSDHFDSFCLFQFMLLKAARQYGDFSAEYQKMEFMSIYHDGNMDEEFISKEKMLLSLITSIEVRNYGESLVKQSLRE